MINQNLSFLMPCLLKLKKVMFWFSLTCWCMGAMSISKGFEKPIFNTQNSNLIIFQVWKGSSYATCSTCISRWSAIKRNAQISWPRVGSKRKEQHQGNPLKGDLMKLSQLFCYYRLLIFPSVLKSRVFLLDYLNED